MDTHRPDRPSWRCVVDRHPWPCPVWRAQLRQDFEGDPLSLAAYLGGFLAAALIDLSVAAPIVYQQVVGWMRTDPHSLLPYLRRGGPPV
jgi:hypothetical protein